MVKVDKDYPVPEPSKGGRPQKFPFASMDVGESVYYPENWSEDGKSTKHLVDVAHNTGIYSGKKFTTRKQPCGGVRIWRVA